MDSMVMKVTMMAMAGSMLWVTQAAAQVAPSTSRAARVRIVRGPEIELAQPDFAIIRWTSNNPGGTPEHEGVVRYGIDPKNLSRTAMSPIRLNPEHSQVVFRVRLDGLAPRTTYYYTVDEAESTGRSDGLKSAVKQFTTP